MHQEDTPLCDRTILPGQARIAESGIKVQVCEKNCGSEKGRLVKNGGAEGGGWCEREFQEEAGEEPIRVGWTRGKNGRGQLTEKADALRVEGRRRLRWEDCMKRDLPGVGGEWRMSARDKVEETAVKQDE